MQRIFTSKKSTVFLWATREIKAEKRKRETENFHFLLFGFHISVFSFHLLKFCIESLHRKTHHIEV